MKRLAVLGLVALFSCRDSDVLTWIQDHVQQTENPETGGEAEPDVPSNTDPVPSDPAPEPLGPGWVGPEGGETEVGAGVMVRVPEHSVLEDVHIEASMEDLVEVEAPDGVAMSVVLEPSGMVFAQPMEVIVPMPEDWLQAGMDFYLVPDAEEASEDYVPQISRAESTIVDESHVSVRVNHFSKLWAMAKTLSPCGEAKKVKDIKSEDVATLCTRGISDQILEVFRDENPTALQPATLRNIVLDEGTYNWVSERVFSGLARAVDTVETPLFIVTTWRSVATQYVISNARLNAAGAMLVAKVGTSPHSVGAGLDIDASVISKRRLFNKYIGVLPGLPKSKQACTLVFNTEGCKCDLGTEGCDAVGQNLKCEADKIFEGQTSLQLGFDFQKSCTPDRGVCCDPVHWDPKLVNGKKDPNLDLIPASTRAFQKLWNANNPCATESEKLEGATTIAEVDAATIKAIAESPREGWVPNLMVDAFPEEGVLGAGCDERTATKTCCKDGSAYSCKNTCDEEPLPDPVCGHVGEPCCTDNGGACHQGAYCLGATNSVGTKGTCIACGGQGEACCEQYFIEEIVDGYPTTTDHKYCEGDLACHLGLNEDPISPGENRYCTVNDPCKVNGVALVHCPAIGGIYDCCDAQCAGPGERLFLSYSYTYGADEMYDPDYGRTGYSFDLATCTETAYRYGKDCPPVRYDFGESITYYSCFTFYNYDENGRPTTLACVDARPYTCTVEKAPVVTEAFCKQLIDYALRTGDYSEYSNCIRDFPQLAPPPP